MRTHSSVGGHMLFKIIEQQERRFDMIEKNRIASIIDTLIEECGECPLERICNEDECTHVWERFLEAKVKEDGVEIEEQKSYEVDHAQNYNKTLEHNADIIRKHMNDGWISAKERLPEVFGKYWATIRYDDGRISEPIVVDFRGVRQKYVVDTPNGREYETWGIDSAFHGSRVIAWRPYYIPEPYRPERSEGE